MENINGFIDIHNHILPGIDDGSPNIEETEQMLRVAANEGIGVMVATPHYDMDRNHQNKDQILELTAQVQELAEKIQPGMKIYSGAEVLYDVGILEDIKAGLIPCIGAGNYILLEFYPDIRYNILCASVHGVINAGYTPIIAHLERYECLIRTTKRIPELIKMGATMQMNSRSLLGGLMDKRSRICRKMVTSGYVHFLGSDSHSATRRAPSMRETEKVLRKLGGDYLVDKLLRENPQKMLQGEYI